MRIKHSSDAPGYHPGEGSSILTYPLQIYSLTYLYNHIIKNVKDGRIFGEKIDINNYKELIAAAYNFGVMTEKRSVLEVNNLEDE